MSLHFRIIHPGTLIDDDGKLKFIDTKTPYTMSGCVYPSWHTDGNLIAYSLVRLEPETFSQNDKYVDVADEASDLVVYNIKTNILTTSPKISTENRENLPTWSPDGKWLYYISAPQYKASLNNLHRVKYDLVRIAYNAQSNTWGDVDTVLTSRQTGMSISFPLISPDGKYLMFCMTDYGYFTAYHKISDLYLLDLETHKYKKLNINSSSNESYHSWSSNGRWLVFGSKRLDDIYTRPFFTYFDKEGNTYKPFILPQKDPDIYTYLLANYNRSELITGKIEINRNAIRDLLFTKPVPVQFDTAIDIDALSGASKIKKQE
jgi:Tol biopolymer transport system component